MLTARKVALRVNGVQVTKAKLRRGKDRAELVVTDLLLSDFVLDESFTLEILELVHPSELRQRLPNRGWRRVSLRILISLLENGVVRVVEERQRR